MFTGIIESVGVLRSLKKIGADYAVFIESNNLDLSDVKIGDSIAVNGVCLTATKLTADGFVADVSAETVRKTRFAHLKQGSPVNLEKALTPATRLGGHLVSGHVDGIGTVIERKDDGRSVFFRIKAPTSLSKYIAAKGSITIDGVSLTVNAVYEDKFELNIVPHTLEETTLKMLSSGDDINLEVDLIARYLERLLTAQTTDDSAQLSMGFLAENGFIR
jgi:riboflavin synthase